MLLNVTQCFSILFNVTRCYSVLLNVIQCYCNDSRLARTPGYTWCYSTIPICTWYVGPSHWTRVTTEQGDQGDESDIEDGRLARTPEYSQSYSNTLVQVVSCIRVLALMIYFSSFLAARAAPCLHSERSTRQCALIWLENLQHPYTSK